MKKSNKKKLISQFIKLLKQKYNNMLNRTFNSLKIFKIFKKSNQSKNKAKMNLPLIFVAFQEL